MLTDKQLQDLMRDIESDRVERTVSTADTAKYCKAICAFANDFPNLKMPGYLMIGVDDAGKPSGLKVTDRLLQALASHRSNGNIQPLPAMTVQRHAVPEGDIAVVEVLPSDLPPVRYEGQVWIRVGPSRRIANEQEERILVERRQASGRSMYAHAGDAGWKRSSWISFLSPIVLWRWPARLWRRTIAMSTSRWPP